MSPKVDSLSTIQLFCITMYLINLVLCHFRKKKKKKGLVITVIFYHMNLDREPTMLGDRIHQLGRAQD